MNRAWASFLDHSKGTRTQDMFTQNSGKIIRNSTTPMKTFYRYLKKLTSSSTFKCYKFQNQIRVDVYFCTEDAANFFINKHIEIRGKPIPFICKAKQILKVTIKGVDIQA